MSQAFNVEEKLIELVRSKQFLYDKATEGYKDVTRKDNAYQEIGQQIGLSGSQTKDLWEKIKKQYTNYLGKLKNPSGSGAGRPPYFRHSGAMNFYQAVYKPYKSISNIDDAVDEEELFEETDNGVDPGASNDAFQVAFEGFDGSPPEVIIHPPKSGGTPTVPSKARHAKKRSAPTDDFNERLFSAIEKTSDTQGDEFDHVGANVAAKIRKLSLKNARLSSLLQLEIQKLLTDFELKSLSEEASEQSTGRAQP